jgi:hypothetical protein
MLVVATRMLCGHFIKFPAEFDETVLLQQFTLQCDGQTETDRHLAILSPAAADVLGSHFNTASSFSAENVVADLSDQPPWFLGEPNS